jgi:hypothetical protein
MPHPSTFMRQHVPVQVSEDIRLLKIDVEGFEGLALNGATALFKQHKIHYILSEVSPCNMKQLTGITLSQYLHALHQQGFDVYLVDYSGDTRNERAAAGKPAPALLAGAELVRIIEEAGPLKKESLRNHLIRPEKIDAFSLDMECGQVCLSPSNRVCPRKHDE